MDNQDIVTVAGFNGYLIKDVYRKLTTAGIFRIIEFWRRNGALSSNITMAEAERRAGQVAVLVEKDGEIAAVSSVYVAKASRDGELYYFYRKFVQKEHRVHLLWREMLAQTYKLLKAWDPAVLKQKPIGVMVVPENRKLTRKSVLRAGNKIGFYTVGYLQNGDPVYSRKFDESVKENMPRPEGTPVPEEI